MSDILELAKKLKALADRGVGGEKTNADTMLLKLMKKHNITWDELEQDKVIIHEFLMSDEEWKFLTQVASSVVGKHYRGITYKYKLKRSNRADKRRGLEVSQTDFVEIMAKHAFFYREYQNEMKLFYSAFVQKNKIFMKETDEEIEAREHRELTPAERAELFRIANIMQGLERKTFNKQIG